MRAQTITLVASAHWVAVAPVNTKYAKRAHLHMYFCMLAILLFFVAYI